MIGTNSQNRSTIYWKALTKMPRLPYFGINPPWKKTQVVLIEPPISARIDLQYGRMKRRPVLGVLIMAHLRTGSPSGIALIFGVHAVCEKQK
ncbi:hypothetical protein [uncultured Methanoregula sp.]|uniref:hypothetical protein n=1 Tax=uncultured Methanoregula sp. TaxID=1005933 RepID=UPI003748773F